MHWRDAIALVGIEACPLSEWLYGGLVECGFHTVCIETRHAQRFLSSRPNKTDRSDARGIADMMRLGHYRAVHVKSKASQLLRTMVIARRKFVASHVAGWHGFPVWRAACVAYRIGSFRRCRAPWKIAPSASRGIAPSLDN
jgi:Transposase